MSEQPFQFESGPRSITLAKFVFLISIFFLIPTLIVYLLTQYGN